jgi:hypothetical protein
MNIYIFDRMKIDEKKFIFRCIRFFGTLSQSILTNPATLHVIVAEVNLSLAQKVDKKLLARPSTWENVSS